MGSGDCRTDALIHEIQQLKNRNKELEEKLRSNQRTIKDQMQQFEKIIEGTNIGTWAWNVQTGETVFNERWAEIIGYTLEELHPVDINTWMKYAHPDDLIKSGEALQKHFAKETEFYECESRMKHKDGHWVWVLDKGQVMEWSDDGKPLWMYGSHIDITATKNAELAKQEQYQLMNLLFTQSLTGKFFMMLDEPVVWNDSVDKEKVLDYVFAHQRITQVNQAMLDQYRAKAEDFIGATPNRLFAHDVKQGRQAWRKLFDEGHLHIDTYEQRFDGSDMAVLGDYICLYDGQGRITGHFGVQIDITNRKRTEEALAESEKRYNLALETTEAGLWDWDIINNTVYFSPLWKRMLGHEDHEVEDSIAAWKSLWHPDDAAAIEKAMVDYRQGKTKKYELTYRLRHKNGEWRWILTRGRYLKDAAGNPYRWIGTNTDITQLVNERKESEELERFFAVNPELMCIADHKANLITFNQAWTEVTGYSPEEIKGRKHLDFVHPEDIQSTLEAAKELSQQHKVIKFTNRYRCKNGSYRHFEWSCSPYGDLVYASARDITDKIEYENRLKQDLAIKEKLVELINGGHHSVDEFLHGTLDLVISFTASNIGYIFLYDEEKEEFLLHSWSESVLAECRIKDQKRLYYLGDIGLWGEVVRQRKEIIINDYSAMAMKKGYPQGHIPIKNFISIPVFYDGKIVAVVAGANKETNYTQEDAVNLNLLFNSVWTEVERFKTHELLKKSREDLLKFAHQIPGMLYQLEVTQDGVYKVPFASEAIMDLYGCSAADVREDFTPVANVIHPDDMLLINSEIRESIQSMSTFRCEYRVILPGKEVKWLLAKSAPEKLPTGSVVFNGFTTDITHRKKMEEALLREKELFSTTIFSLEEGIIVADISGKITMMNPTAEKYTGWTNTEAVGRDFHEVFNNVDFKTKKRARNPVESVLETGESIDSAGYIALIAKDGSETYMTGRASKITSATGELTGVVVAFKNVTKEFLQEQEIQGFLNLNIEMLYVGDVQGNFHKVNKKFAEVLGYRIEDMAGKNFMDFVHPDDVLLTVETLGSLGENQTVTGFINRYRCKDGFYKFIEWNTQRGSGNYVYSSARDVTEKKLNEEDLRTKAIKDKLTGLYNRHYLETVIDGLMDQSEQNSESLSMAILDLDFFKKVNDNFGHPIGDDLLKVTAKTIVNAVRKSDVVIRFGGEEFVILMPHTSKEQAARTGERIRVIIENNHHPVAGKQTISVGVAERMHYESFGNWYKRADSALYDAKQGGRNRVCAADELDGYINGPMPVVWRPAWESGNSDIDRQHKTMIEIADRLIYLVMKDENQDKILIQLDTLLNHVRGHFAREEAVLQTMGYPEYGVHQELHRSLLAKALSAKESYIKGDIRASAFFSFIVDDVIIGHLEKEDVKFFPYVKIK